MADELLPPTVTAQPSGGIDTRTPVRDHEATGDYIPDASFTPLPNVPGYDVQKELGRGGMGVVFLALHNELKRFVALKMLLQPGLSPSALARFQTEAEALAALQHPHIVQIFARGTYEGQPFLAMEYCPGGSLASRVREAPLPQNEAARVVEQLARAVAAAHERHILHRDLKPANVLVASDGTLKIADFGLAKRLDATGDDLTQTNAVMGTPSYMAPEQAAGQPVGPTADIYSLGAILYRLLAGRPPFVGASNAVTLQMVIHDDPLPLRQLDATLHRDLETIGLKCLHKTPAHRYANALALADDLGRFLRREPILARPATWREQGWKWIKRHPARAAMLLTLSTLFLTLTSAATFVAHRERLAAQEQADLNGKLRQQQRAKDEALQRERLGAARLALDRGQMLCEQGDVARGLLVFIAGLEPAQAASADDYESALRYNIAAWERELWSLRLREQGPDGSHVAGAQLHPRGALAALALTNQTVILQPLADPPSSPQVLAHDGLVLQLAFSADGARLLTRTATTVRVWDVAKRTVLTMLPCKEYSPAALSPGGTHVVTVAKNGVAQVRSLDDPSAPVCELRALHPTSLLLFAPTGTHVLTANLHELRQWTLAGAAHGDPLQHDGMLWSVQYNPTGTEIVAAVRQSPRVGQPVVYRWETASGRMLAEHPFAGGTNPEVSFSPDGALYAVRSQEGNIQLRRTATGEILPSPTTLFGAATAITFGPQGTLLVGGRDGALRTWNLRTNAPEGAIMHHQAAPRSLALTADGRQLVVVDGSFYLWEQARGCRRGPPLPHQGNITCASFHPAGKQWATGSSDGKLRVWSDRGQPLAEVDAQQGKLGGVAYTSDGSQALTFGVAPVVHVWDTATWHVQRSIALDAASDALRTYFHAPSNTLFTIENQRWVRWRTLADVLPITVAHETQVVALAVRPDGGAVLSADRTKIVRLWDRADGKLRAELPHDQSVDSVAFTPDGRYALTKCNQQVYLWDGQTGQARGPLQTPSEPGTALVFRADGQYGIVLGASPTTRLRTFPDGQPVGRLLRHHEAIVRAAFAPDGQTLLTASADHTARRWHVPTGVPIGPVMLHTDQLLTLALHPEGEYCVVGGWSGNVARWETPPATPLARTDWQAAIEQRAGLRELADGTTQPMSAAEWRARRR